MPAIGKEGSEILRDAQDAKDWQEAVKSELVAEINSRVSKQMDESRELLTTVHSSIELFQNNADLVPGTKGFDADLANRFVALATPYELRVEGKLRGYSIPVQPIIDQLRSQIAAERAKAPAAVAPVAGATQSAGAAGAAASTPAAPAAAPQASDAPQAGIESKAGNSSSSEDFSALFGTLGLPNLRI